MSFLIRDAFAQAPATTAEIATPSAPIPEALSANKMITDNVMMLAVLFGIFYFILIRPQQKRLKAHRDLLGGITKGNKVITNGGLIGTVIKLEGEDVVVLEIAQNVRVRIAKSAIAEISAEKGTQSDSANDN